VNESSLVFFIDEKNVLAKNNMFLDTMYHLLCNLSKPLIRGIFEEMRRRFQDALDTVTKRKMVLERKQFREKGDLKMKRTGMKHLILMCAVLVMVSASLSVSALTTYMSGSKTKVYTNPFYKVYYEGKLVTDAKHPALKINDNIMIPYKCCLVQRGPRARYTFNSSKKRLIITLADRKVKLYLNKKTMYINGKKDKVYTAPRYVTVNGCKYITIPGKAVCRALDLDYTYVKPEKTVYLEAKDKPEPLTSTSTKSNLTAKDLQGLTTSQFIKLMGPLAQQDYQKTGVLASVTLAQMINESGWGSTTLCKKGNNIFGMKINLSGNTWKGSTWDGKSKVKIYTREEYKGKKVTITAYFRKYPNLAKSIGDHSAYLKGAMDGSKKRYAGLTSTTSYKKQLKIIQKGGYCTWSSYVSELTNLIKKYNLTKYDVKK